MAVRRISRPPSIAPERAFRSEASKFHAQIQLATKTAAKEHRFAPVSADGGGRNPGLPSARPWSFAPVHHEVAADAATQDRPAQVGTEDRAVQDGEQQREAEGAATAWADADLEPSKEGCAGILDDVVAGKTLDEIADELGLTRDEVIAALEAAGYEVETAAPMSANGDVEGTEIVDVETGEVVAGHYYDHQHDAETVRYVDEDGNAVSRTEYEGETVEHVVEEGESLWAIAEEYGVTLEELEEANPEYFETPRDPDLIYPGETILIEGGNAGDEDPVQEADEALDNALTDLEEEFKNDYVEDHEDEGVWIDEDRMLHLPAYLQDQLQEDYQDWLNQHPQEVETLNALQLDYAEAVASELRLAALEAERLGEVVSEQADEIRERDTDGDGEDELAADAIDAAEQQVLGESPEVREAQVEAAREGQELEDALDTLADAESLPDNLSDKQQEVTAAGAAVAEERAEFEEAAAVRGAAVAEEMEALGREVLVELAGDLGVELPYQYAGDGATEVALSNEELASAITAALADPQSLAGAVEGLDETSRDALAAALGVEPDHLAAVLGDPGQLAEALGVEDEEAALDVLADELTDLAAGDVSEAHGNNSYIDNLLFGDDYSPGVVDQVAIDLRVGELASIIEEIDPEELSGVEKELWEAGDQASVALLRQLGVSYGVGQETFPEGGGETGGDFIYAIVDGERTRLSGAEEELLHADPVALALFLKAGFRLEGGSGGSIGLAFDGVSYTTVEEQIGSLERSELEELAGQLGVTAPNADHYRPGELPQTLADLSDEELRAAVLDHIEASGEIPDSLSPTPADLAQLLAGEAQDQQALASWLEETLTQASGNPDALAAVAGGLWWYGKDAESLAADAAVAGALRLQQTEQQVSALIAEGKDDEAQRLLTGAMDAALSEAERAILLEEVGLRHFGEDYWAAELDGLIAAYEEYWTVQSDGSVVTEGVIADHNGSLSWALGDWFVGIRDSISPEMAAIILGLVEDRVDLDMLDTDDSAFFNGLSAIVSVADQRADPGGAASWAERMAEWLTRPSEDHPDGYEVSQGNVTMAIMQGSGSALAEAYVENLEENGQLADGDYQEWQDTIDEAGQHPDAMAEQAATQFNYLEDNKHNIVPDYLERIMGRDGVGEPQQVVYGDELRDLIAAGMDLDWRNNEVDRASVDLIMDEMFKEAGVAEDERETTPITVTVIPYIYAAKRDGWATGALFAVDGENTESERIVSGGGYAQTVTETDANEFVIDGGVIANLAAQAAVDGTAIDAITREQPWRFDSVEHFQDKNYLAEDGLLYLPYELGEQYGLKMELFGPRADGDVRVGTTAAAIQTNGERVWKEVDKWVTIASVVAMFAPVVGVAASSLLRGTSMALRAARFAEGTVAASRAALLSGAAYAGVHGAHRLNEMRDRGIDTGSSNREARSIYLDMLGTAAGIGAMAGSRLTQRLLAVSGPGYVSNAARAAYWSTQAGNAVDLTTGAALILDSLRQIDLAGEDASAFDKLMTAMGAGLLVLGGLGMRHDSRFYNAHLNQSPEDYIRTALYDEAAQLWLQAGRGKKGGVSSFLAEAVTNRFAARVGEGAHHHWLREMLERPPRPQGPASDSIFHRPPASGMVPSIQELLDGCSPLIASQWGGKVPELEAAILKEHGFKLKSPKDWSKPWNLDLRWAALVTLLVQLGVGSLGPFNFMSNTAAGLIANVRSAYSKLSWKMYNQIMVPVIQLAAKGEVDKALRRLRRTLRWAPMWGAARLNRQEMAALRALVREIGKAGAEYRKAVEALPPDLRKVLPRIQIRKLLQDQQVVDGWLPGNLRDVPEFHSMLTAMTEGTSRDTYVEELSETLRALSERLDGLAPEDRQNIGFLMARLSTTQEARQANQNLYDLLGERLGETADGRVDYKAAEKLPGSSQAPATWPGYFFKMAAFGTAFNMVLGWLTKGVPIGGEWYDWGRFLSDPIRAVPAAWFNAQYLMLLRKIKEFKEAYPYPRTPEKELEFQELEAKRKELNGKLDKLGWFSTIAYFLSGYYYLKQGNVFMANLLFAQAASSGAWVTVQQETHKEVARKLGIDPGVVEKLEIHPIGKAAMRWSAIVAGVSVPPIVLAYEDYLSDDDDKAERPSLLDYVLEGFNALAYELDGSGHLPADPLDEPIVLPSLVAAEPSATSDPEPRAIDEAGNVWVPISAHGPEGWVSSNFVSAHQNGDQDENGRINSQLDQLGYRWVEAKTDDNMRRIAVSHSVDVTELVILNMDHIPDPDLIYPRDRIYLPN